AFSTENWRRSPDEVRFLMGFNRDVIHRRRDLLNEMGVCIRWPGRRPRLWRSVIRELEQAEQMSAGSSGLTLQFSVNYGGRAEIADAAAAPAATAGTAAPSRIRSLQARPSASQPPDDPVPESDPRPLRRSTPVDPTRAVAPLRSRPPHAHDGSLVLLCRKFHMWVCGATAWAAWPPAPIRVEVRGLPPR